VPVVAPVAEVAEVATVAEVVEVAEVATAVVTTAAGEPVEVGFEVELLILAVVFEFAVVDDKAGFGEEFAEEETVVLPFPFAEEFVDCAVSVRPGEDIKTTEYDCFWVLDINGGWISIDRNLQRHYMKCNCIKRPV
jgi:hypothetical protein